MKKHDHNKIEKKWQRYWKKKKLFLAKDFSSKKKFYPLIEFPYPSAEGLHVGHPRSYTALDIIARKRRMQGYNVLYPIGFDAFGLPAENFAVKTGTHPKSTTAKNIKNITRQLKELGFSFDWSRAFSTTDPKYYKWTQWIFLQFFKHGMAYKQKMPINWCPSCKIGLANEEVVTGMCERCNTPVEKREKEQWLLSITRYADRLLEDLEKVDYWEKIKAQQRNWIGRSEGVFIKFQIFCLIGGSLYRGDKFSSSSISDEGNNPLSSPPHEGGIGGVIEIFTTRPDTIFGATFLVIAPEHPIISNFKFQISNFEEVHDYIDKAKRKSELERTEMAKEKTGVKLKGIKAINPANGESISIFVADYALLSYGTGAIMGVPAHDQRDYEFAKKYKLPIIEVVFPITKPLSTLSPGKRGRGEGEKLQQAYEDTENGTLVNSGEFNGLAAREGARKITQWLKLKKFARKTVQYKLHDWIFSRQRYWGEPIPLVYCEACKKWIAVPEKDLPVRLPDVKKYKPDDTGESPLAKCVAWVNTQCPECRGPARRETDVMPNWAGSNWYYLRYCDPKNNTTMADSKKISYWIPVDWYNGGMEHTTLHLLYSRFVYKFLWDIGVIPKECGPEPYKKRTSHGIILGDGGEKMSKSRGNVVNPDDIVKKFGADVLRMYEMFIGPFDCATSWDTKGIVGIKRFLDRVYLYAQENKKTRKQKNRKVSENYLERTLHKTIKKVGEDIERMRFNTAISELMILFNTIQKEKNRDAFETFLTLISPFAPHISEEIWHRFGHTTSIMLAPWPHHNEKLVEQGPLHIVIQVNGRVRDTIVSASDISEQDLLARALASKKIQKYAARESISKTIYVTGRLLNIVTRS